jgi:hypothetical protein
MRNLFLIGSLAALALNSGLALAHHGWADTEEEQFELTGVVVKTVSFAGPHAYLQIRDKEDTVWTITLAPPTRTERYGLKEDTIPLGAEITASGHRSKDPKRYEVKTERVHYQGTVYNVYPDRD